MGHTTGDVRAARRARTDGTTVAPWHEIGGARHGDTSVSTTSGLHHHTGTGTAFVIALDRAEIESGGERFPVPRHGYAVLPDPATVVGGPALVITARSHRGLFSIGGPAEETGRLRYIDGCTDTVLVAPVVCGDPCLNLLTIPPHVRQTDHEHPSLRVGAILSGAGRCVLSDDRVHELVPGVVFILPAGQTHRFETEDESLRIVAWHPDSDTGPSDADHPMLNRTLLPGTNQRVR